MNMEQSTTITYSYERGIVTMRKRCIRVFLVIFLILLSGCKHADQPSITTNPDIPETNISTVPNNTIPAQTDTPMIAMSEEAFREYLSNTTEIRVYRCSPEGAQTFSYQIDGKVHTMSYAEEVYCAIDATEVAKIVELFTNWDIVANQVPHNELLDLLCETYICFDSGLTVQCGEFTEDCYGYIDGHAYYLPAAFVTFVDGL